jgi:endonuclease YncB( thermonuclease family)
MLSPRFVFRPLGLTGALGLAACLPPFGATAACTLKQMPEAVLARRALDGDTVLLADGREVRLAGVAAPRTPLGVPAGAWRLDEDSRAALESAVAGKALALRPAAAKPDRHGRVLGFLAPADSTDHAGVASELLAKGLLRWLADRTGRDCGATLLASEEPARSQRLGLWSDPYYEVRDAADGAAFADRTGAFVVAEGRVASVRSASGRTYVNFGRRWRDALSLVFSEAALARLGGVAALRIETGARLRVRGVIERRAGPIIAIAEAGQVERIGDSGRKR